METYWSVLPRDVLGLILPFVFPMNFIWDLTFSAFHNNYEEERVNVESQLPRLRAWVALTGLGSEVWDLWIPLLGSRISCSHSEEVTIGIFALTRSSSNLHSTMHFLLRAGFVEKYVQQLKRIRTNHSVTSSLLSLSFLELNQVWRYLYYGLCDELIFCLIERYHVTFDLDLLDAYRSPRLIRFFLNQGKTLSVGSILRHSSLPGYQITPQELVDLVPTLTVEDLYWVMRNSLIDRVAILEQMLPKVDYSVPISGMIQQNFLFFWEPLLVAYPEKTPFWLSLFAQVAPHLTNLKLERVIPRLILRLIPVHPPEVILPLYRTLFSLPHLHSNFLLFHYPRVPLALRPPLHPLIQEALSTHRLRRYRWMDSF